jgi:methylmalonyl-CoA mutase, N-terminal domain
MYARRGRAAGVDAGDLGGTLQTDIFKEYIAQKEWLFPPEPHLRLIGDLMEYCTAEHVPRYNPISSPATTSARPARRPRRSSRSPWPTASPTSSWAVPRAGRRQFAPGCLLLRRHIDFFEEIAKFRAARRIWARWLRERYGATERRRSGCASTPRPPGCR